MDPKLIISGGSLAANASALNKKFFKVKFEIIGKTKEWYDENYSVEMHEKMDRYLDTNINNLEVECEGKMKYVKPPGFLHENYWAFCLRFDVLALAELILQFHSVLEVMGRHILLGPTAASHIKSIIKQKFPHECVVHLSDPGYREMVRVSVYGGRVLHFARELKNCISLDANSLYPAAMSKGEFPIGKPIRIRDDNDYQRVLAEGKNFIISCEMDAGNRRFPLIQSRTPKGEIILVAGKFRGVYTSVDVPEAMKMGYKITFFSGMYWEQSVKIFEDLITKLYAARLKYKQSGNEAMSLCVKILMNSGYGAYLCSIKRKKKLINSDKFNKRDGDEETDEVLHQDWVPTVESTSKLLQESAGSYSVTGMSLVSWEENEDTWAPYIAFFILGYSRKIMNDIIMKIGVKNVAYGDTDSIYVSMKSWEEAKKLGLCESTALGGFKNDYDSGSIILRGIFSYGKRYHLTIKTKDGTVKDTAKFAGLNHILIEDKTYYLTNKIYQVTETGEKRVKGRKVKGTTEYKTPALDLFRQIHELAYNCDEEDEFSVISEKLKLSGVSVLEKSKLDRSPENLDVYVYDKSIALQDCSSRRGVWGEGQPKTTDLEKMKFTPFGFCSKRARTQYPKAMDWKTWDDEIAEERKSDNTISTLEISDTPKSVCKKKLKQFAVFDCDEQLSTQIAPSFLWHPEEKLMFKIGPYNSTGMKSRLPKEERSYLSLLEYSNYGVKGKRFYLVGSLNDFFADPSPFVPCIGLD